jgi:hypothetical protein
MMADLPISLLNFVGNTGYTDNDLLVLVNYNTIPAETVKTTFIQHKEWVLSGLTYLPLSGGTVTGNTIFQSGLTANTISASTISGGTFFGNGSGLTNVQNLYNIDGTLQSNRVVNLSSFILNFSSTTNPDTLVLNGGNVGIGTSTPSKKLDVNGQSIFRGNVEILSGNRLGIGISSPAYNLDVDSTSNPARFTGVQTLNTDTEVVTLDANGVIHKRPYDYITGFTYTSSANTFTITTTSGNTFNAYINQMSGLTIDGDLTVLGDYVVSGDTIISGNTIFSGTTTMDNVPNAIGDFLTLPTNNIVSRRTAHEVRDDIGYYGLTFAITNGYY